MIDPIHPDDLAFGAILRALLPGITPRRACYGPDGLNARPTRVTIERLRIDGIRIMVQDNGNENEGARPLGAHTIVGIGMVAAAFNMLATRLASSLVGKMSPDEFAALLDNVVVELKNGSALGVSMEDETEGMRQAIESVEDAFRDLNRQFREADQ